MQQKNICDEVIKILSQKNGINAELLVKDNFDQRFTGDLFRMNDIGLSYLFLEIENHFNIIIPFEMIKNYEFNSINNVVEIVNGMLKAKD